ncbi:MAG: hypothetical protein MJE12_04055 [Alphaproteobacteria bacterium]|nr:hypothetical protein [Alphaproteobacteria bacterium]
MHRGLMSLPRSQTGWILPSTQRHTQAASASNANRTKNPKKTIEIARMIDTYGAPSLGAMAPHEILLATQAGAIRPAVWIFGPEARVFCGFVGAFTVRSIWMNNA